MKIAFIAHGSLGDVNPCMAFGSGLRKAGYTVTIVATTEFRKTIEEHDLLYSSLNLEIKELYNERVTDSIDKNKKGRSMSSDKNKLEIKKVFGESLNNAYMAGKGCDFLFLSGVAMYYGPHIAEKLNVPYMNLWSYPTRRTSAIPAFLFPHWNLGGWYNRLTYKISDNLFWMLAGKTINEWRYNNNLKLLKGKDIFTNNHITPRPAIFCYSQHVFPKPPDYDDTILVPGFFFLGDEKNWQPSSELMEFLEAGPPPVYIGFGSVSEFSRNSYKNFHLIILEALKQTGQRGLLADGNNIKKNELPDTICTIEYAPYNWLFPRMKAVVHHGGPGTMAEGLRAGIPSVILPIMGDQPFWGECIFRTGAGPKPIDFKKITVAKLANAIDEAVNNQKIAENARLIGKKIRNEDGVANAVRFFNQIIEASRRIS